tara:strand:+ start:4668 stop:4856 length:189 start_codon:yes stop_codon:yes gene_type:complete
VFRLSNKGIREIGEAIFQKGEFCAFSKKQSMKKKKKKRALKNENSSGNNDNDKNEPGPSLSS